MSSTTQLMLRILIDDAGGRAGKKSALPLACARGLIRSNRSSHYAGASDGSI
jgi:hypothetical protein